MPRAKTRTPEQREELRHIGERICKAREKAGLSQTELAYKIGEVKGQDEARKEQGGISRYESGDTECGILTLAAIAKALNLTVDWLLFGHGEMDHHVTLRDCCKMLFHDLPASFDCSWTINTNDSERIYNGCEWIHDAYHEKKLPTLTYKLILPNEWVYDEETGRRTEYVHLKDEYQPFLTCAEHAQQLESMRKSYPQYSHEEDYEKLFALIPNTPLTDNGKWLPF